MGPIELTENNGPDAANPFLGFAAGGNNPTAILASGASNYCTLTGTHHTAASSPPSLVGNSFGSGSSESTVWSYDIVTHKLTAQWVNPDRSKPTTILYYLPASEYLLITGDATALNSVSPGGYAVTFTLV